MEIVYGPDELERFVAGAAAASPDHPVLIDRFVEGAVEIDVDAVCDGTDVFVGAVMEHIEEAGIHPATRRVRSRRRRCRRTSSTRSSASRRRSRGGSACGG